MIILKVLVYIIVLALTISLLGNNKMIPVGSQDEGNKLISQLNN